jgi:branched-chain amino acid transport system permease protein
VKGLWRVFLQNLVPVSICGIYALMAVGYSLVFSVLGFSNFAHGAVIMLGAYLGLALAMKLHLGIGLVLVGSIVGSGVLAVMNERLAYSVLRRRKAPSLYLMITRVGVFGLSRKSVYARSARFYAFPEFFSRHGVLQFAAARCASRDRSAFVVAFFAALAFHVFVTRTKRHAIRAGVCDMSLCSLMGVNVDSLIMVVVPGRGAFAGVAASSRSSTASTRRWWVTTRPNRAVTRARSLPGGARRRVDPRRVETFVSTYVSSVMRDVLQLPLLSPPCSSGLRTAVRSDTEEKCEAGWITSFRSSRWRPST